MKQRQAVALRIQGKSYDEIAEAMGLKDARNAWDLVNRAMKAHREAVAEHVEHLREIDGQRLTKLWEAMYAIVVGTEDAAADADPEVRIKAATSAVKILERHAKLYGLDAPTKVEAAGKDGGPLVDIIGALKAAAEADKAEGE